MNLRELKQLKIGELAAMARDMDIENASGLRKQELIFALNRRTGGYSVRSELAEITNSATGRLEHLSFSGTALVAEQQTAGHLGGPTEDSGSRRWRGADYEPGFVAVNGASGGIRRNSSEPPPAAGCPSSPPPKKNENKGSGGREHKNYGSPELEEQNCEGGPRAPGKVRDLATPAASGFGERLVDHGRQATSTTPNRQRPMAVEFKTRR